MMKVLITGTHFTPAVAVIEQLKKFDVEIVYVGRRTTLEGDKSASVESQLLPSLGVKFFPIITGRLQRVFTIYTVPSLLKIPIGFIQAMYIILFEKPDVILSFGGYVAVPVVFVGWLCSIPIIVHEQTLVSGLANKISSWFADKIAVSFKNSAFKGEKMILTGNPIRREIIEKLDGVKLSHPRGGLPVVLVMGGSQGSHVINLAVEECLSKLLKISAIYHQTGDSRYRDYERLGTLGEGYQVTRWLGKEYAAVLHKADLVICRAGINTLTELAYLGKPALVIPIPNKEQNKNAFFFERLGLARVLPQSKLSGETILKNVKFMINNLEPLKQKAKKASNVVVPDAAKRLALETMLLIKKDMYLMV